MLQNAMRFDAKRSVICCKTQCVLMLNAVRFGAKYKVKWCLIQGKMLLMECEKHKNPTQMYKQNLLEPLKT